MQGAFPGPAAATGSDWNAILDPGPDEEAVQAQRERHAEFNLNQVREMRAAQARGAPVPALAHEDDTPAPTAPSSRFQLKDKTFFIVRDPPNLAMRDGIWGHYLVSYEQFEGPDEDGNNATLARPYRQPAELPRPCEVPHGAPGTIEGDPKPWPSHLYCQEGVHYVCASPGDGEHPPAYYEIGVQTLRAALEQAEALDLAFAQRMEGLGNVARAAVWDCLDPDYDPGDRRAVVEQFMSSYLERFYTRLEPGNVPDVRAVSEEALHKHRAFCKAWTQKHYKTLMPAVTAPAEALAGEFYPYLQDQMPRLGPDRQGRLTRAELARLLTRHDDFASDFATCLHHYATNLGQSRGGRNASYKQMTQARPRPVPPSTREKLTMSDGGR